MFNLEQAIANWRRQMAAGGIKKPAVLDELESHLREDIERKTALGTDSSAAFKAAVERVGQSSLLNAEFGKVSGTKGVQWGEAVGIACCLVALPLPVWAIPSFLTAREMPMTERLLGLAAVALTFLSVASWLFSYRYLPVIHNRRLRLRVTIACGLGGMAWLYLFSILLFSVIVPHLFSETSAVQRGDSRPIFAMGVAVLWAMALAAVLGGIAFGLEKAARRRFQKDAHA